MDKLWPITIDTTKFKSNIPTVKQDWTTIIPKNPNIKNTPIKSAIPTTGVWTIAPIDTKVPNKTIAPIISNIPQVAPKAKETWWLEWFILNKIVKPVISFWEKYIQPITKEQVANAWPTLWWLTEKEWRVWWAAKAVSWLVYWASTKKEIDDLNKTLDENSKVLPESKVFNEVAKVWLKVPVISLLVAPMIKRSQQTEQYWWSNAANDLGNFITQWLAIVSWPAAILWAWALWATWANEKIAEAQDKLWKFYYEKIGKPYLWLSEEQSKDQVRWVFNTATIPFQVLWLKARAKVTWALKKAATKSNIAKVIKEWPQTKATTASKILNVAAKPTWIATEAVVQNIPDVASLALANVITPEWDKKKTDTWDTIKSAATLWLVWLTPEWVWKIKEKIKWIKKSAIPEVKAKSDDTIIAPTNEQILQSQIDLDKTIAEKQAPTTTTKSTPEEIKAYAQAKKTNPKLTLEEFKKMPTQVESVIPEVVTKKETAPLDKIIQKEVIKEISKKEEVKSVIPEVEAKSIKDIIAEKIAEPVTKEEVAPTETIQDVIAKKLTEETPKIKEEKWFDSMQISKIMDNSFENQPAEKFSKADRFTWAKYSLREAKTWLTQAGKERKIRIAKRANSDQLYIDDGRHLIEAYKELWKEIPKSKIEFVDKQAEALFNKQTEEAPFPVNEQEVAIKQEQADINKDAKDSLIEDARQEWAVRVSTLENIAKPISSAITRTYWATTLLNWIKVKLKNWLEATWSDIVRSFESWKMAIASNLFKRRVKSITDSLDKKYIDDNYSEISKLAKDIIDNSAEIQAKNEKSPKLKDIYYDTFKAIIWWKDITTNIPELAFKKQYKTIEKFAALDYLYWKNPEYFQTNYPELAKYIDDINTKVDEAKTLIYKTAWADLQDRWLLRFIWEDYQHDIVLKSVYDKWLKWQPIEYNFEWKKYEFDSFDDFKRFIALNKDNPLFKNKSLSSILKEKKNLTAFHVKSDLYQLIDYISEYWELIWNDNQYKFIKELVNSKDTWVRKFTENLRWWRAFDDVMLQLAWINANTKWKLDTAIRTASKYAVSKVLLWNIKTLVQATTSWAAKLWMVTLLKWLKKWQVPTLWLGSWDLKKLVSKKWITELSTDIKSATPILEKYWFIEKMDYWPWEDNKSLLNKWVALFAWAKVDKFFKYQTSILMMRWILKDKWIKTTANAWEVAKKFDEMMNWLDTAEQVKIENDIKDYNETISNFNKDGRSWLKVISRIPWMASLKSFGISQTWTSIKWISNIVDWLYRWLVKWDVHWLWKAWKWAWIIWTQLWAWYLVFFTAAQIANSMFEDDEDDLKQEFARKTANQLVWSPADIAINSTIWLLNNVALIPLKDIKSSITSLVDFVRTQNPEAIWLWLDKVLQWFASYQSANNLSWWALDQILKNTIWVEPVDNTKITSWWNIKWVWEVLTDKQNRLFKTFLFDLDSTVANSINNQIKEYWRQAKEAQDKWVEFVPDNTTKNLIEVLIPSLDDIDAKIWYIAKDYQEFVWANQDAAWFEDKGLPWLMKYVSYNKDMDIAQNRNYTYSILSLLEDYEKKWVPMNYDELSKLIWLNEPSIISEAQEKNLTNVSNVNKNIQKYLWTLYPSLWTTYWWDIIAMTKDLKQNNPVAYNNFIWWLVRTKIALDQWKLDQTDKIWQQTLSTAFSSWKNKNMIDASISTYNKTKPLSTSIAEQIKNVISDMWSQDRKQIDNKLALLEWISKLVVKDTAYTKNASDSIAEMVNSLSKWDLEKIYDLWMEERTWLLDKYPTLKELLKYSLTLRWRQVPKEEMQNVSEFIWQEPVQTPATIETPITTTPLVSNIPTVTSWQKKSNSYTSALDAIMKQAPTPKKTKEPKITSITKSLWLDKTSKIPQVIKTSQNTTQQKLSALDQILNPKRR